MKLLLDQNLSRKLKRLLGDAYSTMAHVSDFGLEQADDAVVWQFAKDHGFTIASKDNDFRQMSFLRGQPPKVIWLDVGNGSTSVIADLLQSQVGNVQAFMDEPEAALLVLSV